MSKGKVKSIPWGLQQAKTAFQEPSLIASQESRWSTLISEPAHPMNGKQVSVPSQKGQSEHWDASTPESCRAPARSPGMSDGWMSAVDRPDGQDKRNHLSID
jgi:hypothetical protein